MAERRGHVGWRCLTTGDGARIRWKRGRGRTGLLLVPGFGGDGACWGAAFPRFLSERGVAPVVYDPRGLGGSAGGSPEPSLEVFARDAAAVAEAAGAPLPVLGWSMGASVAAALALARPDLVSALVLCCCPADRRRPARSGPENFSPLTDGDPSEAALALAEALTPPEGWSGPFARAFRRNLSDYFARHEEAVREQQAVLKRLPPLEGMLGRLSLPVLAVEGEGDRLVPPGEGLSAAATKGLIRRTLPGGHGLLYERPRELADLVADFLMEEITAPLSGPGCPGRT